MYELNKNSSNLFNFSEILFAICHFFYKIKNYATLLRMQLSSFSSANTIPLMMLSLLLLLVLPGAQTDRMMFSS